MTPVFIGRRAGTVSVVSALAATLYLGASPAAIAACTTSGATVTCAGASTGVTVGQTATTVTVSNGSTVSVTGFNVVSGGTGNSIDTDTGVASVGTASYGGLILPQIYHFNPSGGAPTFAPPIVEGEDFHGEDVDVVDNAGVSIVINSGGSITSANVDPVANATTRTTYGVFLTGSNNTLTNDGTISIGNQFSQSTMYGVFSSVPTGENYYDNNTIVNNGVIEVTRSGQGTARAIYFGEQQLGMNVQNNATGRISATRVGAITTATNVNPVAAIDTDDTPGTLTVRNASGGVIEATGARTSVIFGRSSGTVITNSGTIQNNSWTSGDTIVSGHYAIGSYAGSVYDADPASPDPDSPLPNIVGGVVGIESAAKLTLNNTATGQITGDVLAVDANPFTTYLLGGGFAQSSTSGNLSSTNVSTRDSEIDNAGTITGNIYLGSGAHVLANSGAISGNIEVNQEYLCRGTGAQLANCGDQALASGTYRIGGERSFTLTNTGSLGTSASEIRIVDYDNFGVRSVNEIDLSGTGFSGSIIAVNGVGDNTVTFNDDMSITTVQGFSQLNLEGSTVTITGAGGVSLQAGADIATTITGAGGTLGSPSTELGRLAFSAGTLTLGGATTVTPTAALAVRSGDVFQVATSTTGGTVTATDTALIDWTASQGGSGLLITADLQDPSAVVPSLSRPALAALNGLIGVDNSNANAAALAGAIQTLADPEDVRRAAEQLAPDTTFATQQAALTLAFLTGQGIDDRLSSVGSAAPLSQSADRTGADLPAAGGAGPASGFWGHAFGANLDQDRKSGVAGYDADIYGGIVGLDHWLTDEFRLGAAIGYAHTKIDYSGDVNGNRTEADSYLASIYGRYDAGGWYANGRAGYIRHDYDTKRELTVGVPGTARGDFNGNQFTASLEVGAPLAVSGFTVTPLAQANFNRLNQDSYRENGGGLALRVDNDDLNSFQSGLGAKIDVPVAEATLLQARAVWLHEFGDRNQSVTASFAGGAPFTAEGPSVGRDSAALGVGLTALTAPGVSFQVDYDALVRAKFIGHSGSAKLRVAF